MILIIRTFLTKWNKPFECNVIICKIRLCLFVVISDASPIQFLVSQDLVRFELGKREFLGKKIKILT